MTALLAPLLLALGLLAAEAETTRQTAGGWMGLDQDLAEPASSAPPTDRRVRVTWTDRLRFETVDKWVRVEVLARVHSDFSTQRASGDLGRDYDWEDGTRFRRASLGFQGRVSSAIGFKIRYEFARGDTRFRDAYLEWREAPFGRVRVGQFREPFGLENHTGGDYLTFAERSVINGLEPRRATGVMALGTFADERGTWAVSATRDADEQGRSVGTGGDTTVSGRVTGLPLYRDGGRDLVHLGTSARISDPRDDELNVTLRPESFLAPTVLDTGAIPVDRTFSYDAQFAWLRGPFSVQAEWTRTHGTARLGPDPTLTGGYVFASWFPTGESRAYETDKGSFGRVQPARPLGGPGGGRGAWELAARYSFAELDDIVNPTDDDRLQSITLGVNWYQTSNTRIVFNYITGRREDLDGRFQIALIRFQVSI